MAIGFQPTATTDRPDDDITNDGFFPSLSLAYFDSHYGVPVDISNERLTQTLLIAAGQVNQALSRFKAERQAQGYETLADVPADTVGDEHLKSLHYRQAVYSKAKATLVRAQISLARKPNAESEAKTSSELLAFYETQATAAIANLQGQRLIGVELI